MTTRTRRSEPRILRACAFHWLTFHVAKWGTLPPTIRARDRAVLREIVRIQASGDEDGALDVLEQLVEIGPPSQPLTERYLAYWLDTEAKAVGRALRAREKRHVATCLRLNIRSVA